MKITLNGPPYRGPGGHYLTRVLFVDLPKTHPSVEDKYVPVFSLYGPVDGYIDARATFIELRDPTGRLWAERYLGSFEHWKRLSESSWFAPELTKWREELNAIFTSEAILRIQQIAASESTQALAASKYLAEQGWVSSKRGRPTKAEIQGELKREVRKLEAHEEDMARIGLKIINGGKTGD